MSFSLATLGLVEGGDGFDLSVTDDSVDVFDDLRHLVETQFVG
ncbi:MAG: hypothetical protein M5U19_07305 [Microthrixaceae bacterium]|nr:hypothetical protein [Microthrixaceae bacterium]